MLITQLHNACRLEELQATKFKIAEENVRLEEQLVSEREARQRLEEEVTTVREQMQIQERAQAALKEVSKRVLPYSNLSK